MLEVALLEEKNTEQTEKNDEQNTVESTEMNEEQTAENNAAEVDNETTVDPENLQPEIDRIRMEKDEVFNRMLRLQAEFDNFKKRTQKEREAERKYKAQDLINEILPALDNFERALHVQVPEAAQSFVDGVSMVYKQFVEALKTHGVTEIETIGKEFDPNIHHAVMQVDEADVESNTIVEELQKGYMLKDRVIRPAMVKVNK